MREMCEAIAESIREKVQANATMKNGAEVTVLVEDKLDSSFRIEEMLGRNNLSVIVGLTGFTRKPQTGPLIFGTANLDISVFEKPMLNRESAGTPTAQMLAEFLIDGLHWAMPEGFDTPLRFQTMTRADEPQTIVVRMLFVADIQLTTLSTED